MASEQLDALQDMPPGDPNPMTEVPILELEDLRRRAIPQEELDFFRATIERLPALEAAAGERSGLAALVSDMTQERDRLKNLLLQTVEQLNQWNPEYPNAVRARGAFSGETPEEIAEKMAIWDAQLNGVVATWQSMVNNIRTQATV